MVTQEQQYLDLLKRILETGTKQSNRTGIDTLFLPGAMLQFDLRTEFPAITTKRLAFNVVKGELIGFLRGYDNASAFRELGCNIWDKNANENEHWLKNYNRNGHDDLGRIYGVQWRKWNAYNSIPGLGMGYEWQPHEYVQSELDQVNTVLQKLYTNPTDRRMIISAWRPDEFDQMALPPCHVLYQFIANVETKELHLCMYQRSCDMFLGVPFNIASASLFLTIMANLSGFTPATFTHFLADAHIYVNHTEQVKEQLAREPYTLPQLEYTGPIVGNGERFGPDIFERLLPENFQLKNYQCHSIIKAPMAV